jgi:hypothetical protein
VGIRGGKEGNNQRRSKMIGTWIVVGILCVMVGFSFVGVIICKRLISDLECRATQSAIEAANNKSLTLGLIQNVCEHSGEWLYNQQEIYRSTMYFSGVLVNEIPYIPSIYTYSKTCTICGKIISMTKDEYDVAMRDVEMLSIEDAREALEARQKKVMGK